MKAKINNDELNLISLAKKTSFGDRVPMRILFLLEKPSQPCLYAKNLEGIANSNQL